jgi:hypothetical protein
VCLTKKKGKGKPHGNINYSPRNEVHAAQLALCVSRRRALAAPPVRAVATGARIARFPLRRQHPPPLINPTRKKNPQQRTEKRSRRDRELQSTPPPQPPTMDPKMTEVTQMFARFKAAYARNDLNTCVTLLSQLKVRYPASLDLYRPPFTSRCPSFSGKFRGWGVGVVISG